MAGLMNCKGLHSTAVSHNHVASGGNAENTHDLMPIQGLTSSWLQITSRRCHNVQPRNNNGRGAMEVFKQQRFRSLEKVGKNAGKLPWSSRHIPYGKPIKTPTNVKACKIGSPLAKLLIRCLSSMTCAALSGLEVWKNMV